MKKLTNWHLLRIIWVKMIVYPVISLCPAFYCVHTYPKGLLFPTTFQCAAVVSGCSCEAPKLKCCMLRLVLHNPILFSLISSVISKVQYFQWNSSVSKDIPENPIKFNLRFLRSQKVPYCKYIPTYPRFSEI